MRAIPLSLALLLWVALPHETRADSPLARPPVRIILDTDMSGDCDDCFSVRKATIKLSPNRGSATSVK